ncbi:preprotein translocase subunit YajC [Mollicutes bacterium LVI A0039]|nr:preprotein translocase subunit YajC [Mollicutes bacterium LVI A0039]
MTLILSLVVPFVFMFGIMYLFLIRPQNKREAQRKSLVDSLQKGDRVRSVGGIVGSVTSVNDTTIVIRSGSGDIELLKESIANKLEN